MRVGSHNLLSTLCPCALQQQHCKVCGWHHCALWLISKAAGWGVVGVWGESLPLWCSENTAKTEKLIISLNFCHQADVTELKTHTNRPKNSFSARAITTLSTASHSNWLFRMCNASCAIPAKCECGVFLFVSLRTTSIFIELQFDNKFVIVFVICMLPFHKKVILGSFRCWADLEHVLKVSYCHWEQQKRDFMTILLN